MVVRVQLGFVMLAACTLALAALPAHAQSGLTDIGNVISIAFAPATPSPGETVTISVQGPFLDMSDSDIIWQINGKKIAQGKGVTSASVQAGKLGEEATVTVAVATAEGTIASAEAVINPTELDLLVDSDSYTPPFYRGASLPSAGTTLLLQAFPRFKRGGAMLPAADLIYTWRRNDRVLGAISGRGKMAAAVPMEHLFGTDVISVEARSADGRLAHISSAVVAAQVPALALYEDHPLYGVLYHLALPKLASISGSEATFVAIPYFAQARNIYDPALDFDWRVNSEDIPASLKNPAGLTINAERSSGVALIELQATHATNFFLDIRSAWNVSFASPWSGGSDQFRNPAQ